MILWLPLLLRTCYVMDSTPSLLPPPAMADYPFWNVVVLVVPAQLPQSSVVLQPTVSPGFPLNSLPRLSIPGDHPPSPDPQLPQISTTPSIQRGLSLPTLLHHSNLESTILLVISLLPTLRRCPPRRNFAAWIILFNTGRALQIRPQKLLYTRLINHCNMQRYRNLSYWQHRWIKILKRAELVKQVAARISNWCVYHIQLGNVIITLSKANIKFNDRCFSR